RAAVLVAAFVADELDRTRERVDLAPVGVALDGGVEQAERGRLPAGVARQEDRAGAGAEQRKRAGAVPRAQRLPEVEEREQVLQRRGLAARQHEVTEAV